MVRPRRRDPVADASSQSGATPAIVLLVSACAALPLRVHAADAGAERSETAPGTLGVRAGAGRADAPATGGPRAPDRLLVPLDLDVAADSAFVRSLLLSHGIELDLGDRFDRRAFVDLVRRLDAGGPAADEVAAEDLDWTLAIAGDGLPGGAPPDALAGSGDVSSDWTRRAWRLEGVALATLPPPEPEIAPASPEGCPVEQDLLDELGASRDLAGGPASRAREALHDRLAETLGRLGLPAPAHGEWRALWLDCDVPELPAAPPPAPSRPVSGADDAELCPFPEEALAGAFAGSADAAQRLHSLVGPPPPRAGDAAIDEWRARPLGCDVPIRPGADARTAPPVVDAPVVDTPVVDAPEIPTSATAPVAPADDGPRQPTSDPSSTAGPTLRLPGPQAPAPNAPGAADAPDTSPGGGPLFTVSDDLPPGFEGLDGPVSRLVDVYLGDRRVGTTGITVTADQFEFDAVEEIVAMLEGVNDMAPLLPVLRGPMPTNAASRCYAPGDPEGCGVLETDTVAALYDEAALRLDVFVSPALLPVGGGGRGYLASPARRPTAIVSLGAVATEGGVAGATGGATLDATGGIVVGLGDTHLRARADYTSRGDRARLREARAIRYAGDYEYGVGSFGFSPGAGLRDADLLGASVATSLRTRTDRVRAFSTELVVYLTRRATVQLLVDDRIYHADTYPSGNSSIDTSALPEGTYELEIRILDDATGARTERRLYTKSATLPPEGQTVVSLTAGVPLSFDDRDAAGPAGGASDASTLGDDRFLPRVGSTPVLGISAARRLGDRDALRLGAVRVGDLTVGQAEYLRLGTRVGVELFASAGARGVLAGGAKLSAFAHGWSASLSHSSARADAGLADDPDHGEAFARLFPGDLDQSHVSLSRAFGTLQAGVRLSRRTAPGRDAQAEQSVFLRRPIVRTRRVRGALEADLARTDETWRAGLSVRFDTGTGGLRAGAYAGVRTVGGDRADSIAGASVSTGRRASETLRWSTGANVDVTGSERRLGVGVELEHPWFAAGASTEWRVAGGGDASRTSLASARAQLGVDADGAAIGAVEQASAGVIVDVVGDPAGGLFDIRVNGVDAGTGTIGRPRFIALSPFQAYRVRIVPRGVLSNGLGERDHDFTLFPGSVQRIDAEARREVLLIATLADERGRAVVDAVFESRRGPVLIDASGVFQAELAPGETHRVTRDGVPVCEFLVPAPTDEEPFLIPERPLPCRAVPALAAARPDAAR